MGISEKSKESERIYRSEYTKHVVYNARCGVSVELNLVPATAGYQYPKRQMHLSAR